MTTTLSRHATMCALYSQRSNEFVEVECEASYDDIDCQVLAAIHTIVRSVTSIA